MTAVRWSGRWARWSSPCVAGKLLTAELALARAEDEARCDCGALEQALGMLPGAARMVVGHTIQDGGINAACGGRVFRIDVGLSKGCGNGEPEVRCARRLGGQVQGFRGCRGLQLQSMQRRGPPVRPCWCIQAASEGRTDSHAYCPLRTNKRRQPGSQRVTQRTSAVQPFQILTETLVAAQWPAVS